jgi:hypothetical protein
MAQRTIHVPADLPTIPQAINQAQNGDTVLVSPGTYIGNFTFQGKAITVASTDGPGVTILDANNVSGGPIFQNGEGPQSVLRGFTITNGMSLSEGAGVFIQRASPTIDGNIITGNHGCEGIGITADNSSAIITNNVITNNTTPGCYGAGGGGIKVAGPGNAQILNNTITSNQVWGDGGGIELNATTMVTITGNTIQNNSAGNYNGGGISVETGSQATIVDNLITANTGLLGSGIYLLFNGNQNLLVNNTIALNKSVTNGQAVWISGGQYGNQLVNNLIIDGTGNGAVACDPSSAFEEIFTSNDILSTQPTTPPQTVPPFVGCADVTGTNGNISIDPQFVNPAGNDYHLQSTSPVIDVGSNTAPDLPDKDLDGNGRIGPGNPSTCVAIVDMGTYEYALTSTGYPFLSPSQDFGTMAVGSSSTPQNLSVFVQGCVQIKSVTTTGDFSQTNTCGHALSTSSSCTLQVTFTPTAGGLRTGSVNIDFGLSASALSTSLSGTGLVIPPSASPTSLAFGNQVLGTTSAAQTVTVSGGGSSTLQISSVSMTGDYTETSSCVGPPVAAPTCFVYVSFAPVTVGHRPGAMVINTNLGSFNVSLDGIGIAPQLQFSTSILYFGNQLLNTTSAPQIVTLTNVGVGPLQILGFDDYDSEFTLTNLQSCVPSLAQGASCTITVTFTPVQVGNKVTGFDVMTNNGNPGVALRGTGVVPGFASLTPSALTFAGQLLNTTSSVQVLTLSNTGGEPLLISSIVASGDFAQTNTCGASLDPGTSCTINVTFTPSAGGSRTGTLMVNSNGGTPTATLSGTGQIDRVTSSPASLAFPLTAVNSTSDAQLVTLTNSGNVAVTIASITAGGDYAQTNTCGTSLDVGASCTINVTFTPSFAGADNDILTITGNFGSPVVVALSGLGQGQGTSGALSPEFLIFSNQGVGTTSPAQTLTYTNTGTDPVSISNIIIAFGPFAQTNNCPASLAPGDSCAINITFTPPDTTGQSGVLNVNGTGSALVSLAGSSLPQLVSPASLEFGNLVINATSPIQTVTFTNTTSNPVNISGVSWPLPFNVVNHCIGTMAVGARCTFDVTFAPTSGGLFSGFFEITGNFSGSPAVLPIAGTGTGSAGALAPSSLTFASQVVGTTSAPQTVTLTNNGTLTLNISDIQTTEDFAQTNNCPATLSPGASCTVSTTFAPTDLGVRSGTLSVTSNAIIAITPVALSGTGAPPEYQGTASPTTLSFADQQVGTTSSRQNFILTNTGAGVLTISNISATGDFSVANGCSTSLAVGSSCQVGVSFAPTALGSRTGTVVLTTNATTQIGPVSLTGNGIGPMPVFSVSSLIFGPQFVGTTSPQQTVTLTNTGTMAFTNVLFTLNGDYSQTNNCGTSVATGASCTINVTFHPSAAGTRQADMVVTGNLYGNPGPSVNVSGIGETMEIAASPTSLSFAASPLNVPSAAQTVTLTNPGDLAVNITNITINGDFAQTNNCGTSLAAGANCAVNVTFTPTVRGARTGVLSLTSSSPGTPPVISLSGTGQAILANASPTSLSFAPAPLNTTSSAQTITFTNSGDLAVAITGVVISGDFAQTNNCGTSLAVGASCSVNVTFTPTARGSRTGTVTLQGNFTTPAAVVNLSGTGQAPLASLTPATFDFGNEPVNTTSNPQLFTYANSGDLPLTISGVAVSRDFSQTNNCPASLAVNVSCTISVTFAPRSTGAQTASLTVSGTLNTSSTVNGTGVMPLATLSPASLNFGSQRAGATSAAQLVTITNTGAFPFFVNQLSIPGSYQATNNCSGVIAVGASCTVSVVFAPSSTQSGPLGGSLTVGGDFTATPSSVSLSGTATSSAGALSPTALTFANQNVEATSAPQTLTLTNIGNGVINLTGIQATGDFAETNNCGTSVAPGSSCSIAVTFTPTTHGARSGTIAVSGDFTGAAPSATLSGTGTTPTASWSPASLSFANQLVSSSSPGQAVTLTNSGDGPLTITAITTTGDFTQTSNCGSGLSPGAGCTITVTFTPSATGSRSGALSLTSNSSIAVNPIALSGTGVAPAASLSPATLTFANQLVNTSSAAQSVTLTNTGTAPLTISNISISGMSSDFSQTNTCGTPLAPSTSCMINVTFIPTAAGGRSAGVIITVDAIAGGQQTVSLSGMGIYPSVALSPPTLTFANQLENSSSTSQSITLSNPGSATLHVSSITASGDFSQANNCGATVAPGASCTINVVFTPAATGNRSGAVTVIDDSFSGTQQTVGLSGTGVAPSAALSPSALNFANQLVNMPSPAQQITLSNSGSVTLNISGIAVTGDFSQTNNCGTAVAAGSSCTILVTFTPTVTTSRTGTLTVSDDPLAGGHQTVSLNGTGVAPAAAFSTGSLGFASQLVNSSSSPQNVTLSNTGTTTLTINSINVTGDFTQTNNCGGGLPAGNSCAVNVTFTPSATGARTGSLTLSSNSSNTVSPVTLSGTGVAPVAALSLGSLSFANQVVNSSSAPQSVNLSNNGTAALTISGISATGDFNQTNNCGASLAAGASCTINVSFTPTASGARTGSLIITDNSFGGSPQTASLSGIGVDFSLSASPSSATVNAGQGATYNVTVTPIGGTFGGSVALSCDGLPAVSTCSFAPAAPTPGSTSVASTLTLITTPRRGHSGSGTPAGNYTITINGSSGNRVQAVNVKLIVN